MIPDKYNKIETAHTPRICTSPYFQARDYKPTYSQFYDPSKAVQRVINAPIGMGEDQTNEQ